MKARPTRRTAAIAAAAMLSASIWVPSSAGGVQVESAGVTASALRSVTFVSSTTGLAAGDGGVIMKTTNGGESWTQVRPADAYSFVGIDFWSASNGVAVDGLGRGASTTDGGSTWGNINFSPYADMDTTGDYSHGDVACEPGGTAAITAAGDDVPGDAARVGGASLRTSGTLEYWRSPAVFTTPHWWYNTGAVEWQREGWGEFLDVEYVTASTVWASGIDYWSTWDERNTEKYPLFRSTDGGVSYTEVPGFGQTNFRLEGVSFGSTTAGATVGQVVGGNRVAYYTVDGGNTWTPASSLPGTALLTAVDMSSATQGWAVSSDGTIIRTTDGGVTWTACTITGGNVNALYDVEFRPGTTIGWAVGASGTVLLTTDGVTWRRPGGSVNQPPIAVADSYSTPQGSAKTVAAPGVLANDSDPEDAALTAILVANPANGTVTLNANGSFTYTPKANWHGTDSFTYKANDGALDSNTVTVTITVTSVAPPPPPIAIYRFYNFTNNTHFFTPSEAEREMVIAKWPHVYTFEGIAYYVNPATNPQPLWRFYNNVSQSHFYTASDDEAAIVLAKYSRTFTLDGRTYPVNPAPVAGATPVYRFLNLKNGSHFYTASVDERETVIAKYPTVYRLEGPAFWLGQ